MQNDTEAEQENQGESEVLDGLPTPQAYKGKKRGPKKFMPSPEVIAASRKMAAAGVLKKDIALALGISQTTLYEAFQRDPQLAEAINQGRAIGLTKAAAALGNLIDQGNLGAIIFYLKCWGGWVETQRTIVETTERKSGVLMVPATISSDEWEKTAAAEQGKLQNHDAQRAVGT